MIYGHTNIKNKSNYANSVPFGQYKADKKLQINFAFLTGDLPAACMNQKIFVE